MNLEDSHLEVQRSPRHAKKAKEYSLMLKLDINYGIVKLIRKRAFQRARLNPFQHTIREIGP